MEVVLLRKLSAILGRKQTIRLRLSYQESTPDNLLLSSPIYRSNRADAFIQNALNALKESDLKDNVILVVNKDLDRNRPADITNYEGFPVIYVKAHPDNIDVLKRYVDSKVPVFVRNPPTPVSLFKQPLNIVKVEEVSEFHENTKVQEKETLSTTKAITVEKNGEKWAGDLGRIFGVKENVTKTEIEYVTETTDVVVNKPYASYNKYKLTYAERFDGKPSLYKKEFIRADKQRI